MVERHTGLFERYPQLVTLRGKVPDELVEREVRQKAGEFEHYRELTQEMIPTVRLCDVFPTELERGRIVLHDFLGQWGNVSIEEVAKICLILSWLQPRAIFEFGTFNGATTLQMALNVPENCKIYTLDLPRESTNLATLQISDVDRYLVQKSGAFEFEVGHYFRGTSSEQKIHQLWGDSTKVDLSAYYGQMDLAFVDAAHSYLYVRSDTENALKMVRRGGVVLWHNYLDVLYPDVLRCLHEFSLAGLPIRHLRGTALAVAYITDQVN